MSALSRRRLLRLLRSWAAVWAGLLFLLFTGVTVLTFVVWATDPATADTTPLTDLVFFALGMMIAVGFAAQARNPDQNRAGMLQAGAASLALAAAGVAGARVEPMVGGIMFCAVAGVLFALRPSRSAAMRTDEKPSFPVLTMAAVAVVPSVFYAVRMFTEATAAGPSCFLGQCAAGDRLAEVGAAALAIVLLAVVAGVRVAGWRLPLWSAALAAVLFGVMSLLFPDSKGAVGAGWSVATIAWGVLLPAVGAIKSGGRAVSSTAGA
jgi:hypothetical protein